MRTLVTARPVVTTPFLTRAIVATEILTRPVITAEVPPVVAGAVVPAPLALATALGAVVAAERRPLIPTRVTRPAVIPTPLTLATALGAVITAERRPLPPVVTGPVVPAPLPLTAPSLSTTLRAVIAAEGRTLVARTTIVPAPFLTRPVITAEVPPVVAGAVVPAPLALATALGAVVAAERRPLIPTRVTRPAVIPTPLTLATALRPVTTTEFTTLSRRTLEPPAVAPIVAVIALRPSRRP